MVKESPGVGSTAGVVKEVSDPVRVLCCRVAPIERPEILWFEILYCISSYSASDSVAWRVPISDLDAGRGASDGLGVRTRYGVGGLLGSRVSVCCLVVSECDGIGSTERASSLSVLEFSDSASEE